MGKKKKATYSGAIVAGAAIAVIAIIFARSTGYIPTTEDISQSESTAELDAYYELINELYLTEQINEDEYTVLYSAYESTYLEFTSEVIV